MTPFALVAALLCALATAWLTRPLWRAPDAAGGPPLGLAVALAAFVFGVTGAGYFALGSPDHLGAGPGAAAAAAQGTGSPQGESADGAGALPIEQVAAMVEQLAERMQTRPDDGEGWRMLARSYAALGKHARAVEAYKKAARLHPGDATLLADFAFALAMANQRSFDGEPTTLVERALKIDAQNPKALALAGTVAFDRKDYRGAVQYWERLAQVESTDGQFAQQVRDSIAQARQLAGMPPAATPAAVSAAASAQVSGTVTLAQGLDGRVAPDDTVFVFARAADGNRMPLAILRKRAKDLPLHFTLDDSMAMSPAAKLSSASSVIVGARISKSGDALPRSGDLQGLAAAVAVGASGVKLEINEEVRR